MEIPTGKRLLMEAALKLATATRSIAVLSLREISREAGLNHNTFYRHFKTKDDLGLAVINYVTEELRVKLHSLRYEAAENEAKKLHKRAELNDWEFTLLTARKVNEETLRLFFDYVTDHPHAFIVGVTELHGTSKVVRKALANALDDFAIDMTDDIIALGLVPWLGKETIKGISSILISYLFNQSLIYLEHPKRRAEICNEGQALTMMLFAGALALANSDIGLLKAIPILTQK
jgi:AcrR family transcriptional regulator